MLDVTDLADRGLAANVNASQLARGHADHGVVAFLGQQLRGGAGRADELAAAAERQLDVVNRRTDRDVSERQRVADAHRRLLSTLDRVADLESEWREDIALLAVLVVNECDAGAAVRVVFDGRDLAGDAVLVALEVDLPVELAIAAALVAHRDAPLVVASGVRGQRLEQCLLRLGGRNLIEARNRHEAAPGAGWFELSDWHI